MKTDTIDFNFVNYSVPALIVFSERIYRNIKRNPRFSNIYSLLEDIDMVKSLLLTNYNSVNSECQKQQALINQLREEIIELLKDIAKAVIDRAEGDITLISYSGFYLEKQIKFSQKDDVYSDIVSTK